MLDMKCSNNESTQDLNVNIQPSNPSSIEFDKSNIVDFGNDIVPNDSLHEDKVAQHSESDLDDNFLIYIPSNYFKALSHNSSLAEKLRFMSNHPIQPQYDQLPFNAYKIYFRPLSNTDNTQIPRNWLLFYRKNEKLSCAVK
ncbi:unnamed protein product [Macrosiphum euphorbiae]|nr:unnamed protein product [Macrosiphum euphorbiae]